MRKGPEDCLKVELECALWEGESEEQHQFSQELWRELPFPVIVKRKMAGEGQSWTTTVPKMQKGMTWEHFKEEIRAWALCADGAVEKKLMAVQIAINLPMNHPLRLRERVFDSGEYGVSKLNADNGVEDLITFLDGIFIKDPLSNRYEIWKKVVSYKREKGMDVESYISKYEALFRRAEKNKIMYPDDIKGFMIMEGANLSVLQAQFVTNNCDFKCSDPTVDAPRLFSEIKAGLKKVCGQQSALLGGSGATSLIAEGDLECFLSTERGKNLIKKTLGKRKHSASEGDKEMFKFSCWYCEKQGHRKLDCEEFRKDVKNGTVKKKPWKDLRTDKIETEKTKLEEVKKVVEDDWDDDDGLAWLVATVEKGGTHDIWSEGDGLETFLDEKQNNRQAKEEEFPESNVSLGNGSCNELGGLGGGHSVDQLPLSTIQPGVSGSAEMNILVPEPKEEEASESGVGETMIQWDIEGIEETALLAQQQKDEAILDTGCTSELTRVQWWRTFKENMSERDKQSVRSQEGQKTFKFGGGQKLKSVRKIKFPAYIEGRKVELISDVVDCDLPFLISLKTMRDKGFILDCGNDRATIQMKEGPVEVGLRLGEFGHHYRLLLVHMGEEAICWYSWSEKGE